MMSRVAIVGGSGFIGTNTCVELLKYGHDVTVIDLIPTDVTTVKYIQADATNYEQIESALSRGFDYVYMFAAISDSAENVRDPVRSIQCNVVSLTNVLEAVAAHGIGRIIFSSTVWVYSVTDKVQVTEATPLYITNSDHIYTTSKLTCEALIRNYHSMKKVNYTILRYGIAYGPGCHPDTVMSRFMTNAIHNKTLNITGCGSIYRNFLYVTDHARGNVKALSPRAENHIINLEGAEKITLTRVADRVKKLHGPVHIQYTGAREGDYTGKTVVNLKAKELLDWEPLISFSTGTERMYEHIKKEINNSTSC